MMDLMDQLDVTELRNIIQNEKILQLYDDNRPRFQYQLLEKTLGSSNNVVKLGRQFYMEGDHRDIAIKIIHVAASCDQEPWCDPTATYEKSMNKIRSVVEKNITQFAAAKKLKHRNIVRHHALAVMRSSEDKENFHPTSRKVLPKISIYIFMEYCPDGTLTNFCEKSLTEAQVKDIFLQVVEGLAYIHHHGICFLDLKGDNVVRKDNTFKICDFGEIVPLRLPQTQPWEVPAGRGTRGFMAPEMVDQHTHHGRAADVFSLSSVLKQMITGKHPEADEEGSTVIGVPGEIQNDTFHALQHLLCWCMQNQEHRPTANQVARHPYLRWPNEKFNPQDNLEKIRKLSFGSTVGLYDSKPRPMRTASRSLDEINLLVLANENGGHANVMKFYGAMLCVPPQVYVEQFSVDHSLRNILESRKLENNFRPPRMFHTFNVPEFAQTEFRNGQVSSTALVGVALQVGEALRYLSEKGILFVRLKSEHVKFDHNMRPVVGDFEMAYESQHWSSGLIPKDDWALRRLLSPETLLDNPPQTPTSVWAFGTLMFEMFVLGNLGLSGWQRYSEDPNSLEFIVSYEIDLFCIKKAEVELFPLVFSIIFACWRIHPALRPSFTHILEGLRTVVWEEGFVNYVFWRPEKVKEMSPYKIRKLIAY